MKKILLLVGCAAICAGCATTPNRPRRVQVEPVREKTYVTQEPGARNYNPELRSFERPWPFGPRDAE